MMLKIEVVDEEGGVSVILAYYVAVSVGNTLKYSDKTGCHDLPVARVKSITLVNPE